MADRLSPRERREEDVGGTGHKHGHAPTPSTSSMAEFPSLPEPAVSNSEMRQNQDPGRDIIQEEEELLKRALEESLKLSGPPQAAGCGNASQAGSNAVDDGENDPALRRALVESREEAIEKQREAFRAFENQKREAEAAAEREREEAARASRIARAKAGPGRRRNQQPLDPSELGFFHEPRGRSVESGVVRDQGGKSRSRRKRRARGQLVETRNALPHDTGGDGTMEPPESHRMLSAGATVDVGFSAHDFDDSHRNDDTSPSARSTSTHRRRNRRPARASSQPLGRMGEIAVSVSSREESLHIILDAQSIGEDYVTLAGPASGTPRRWSVIGLQIALEYFADRGHECLAVLPENVVPEERSMSPEESAMLDKIKQQKDPEVLYIQNASDTARLDVLEHAVNVSETEQVVLVTNHTFDQELASLPKGSPFERACREFLMRYKVTFAWYGDEFAPEPRPSTLGC